jgi:uncharacterized protein
MAVESPCTAVCTLDEMGHVCLGCGRTLEEIAAWSGASDERRAAIMARLATRDSDKT